MKFSYSAVVLLANLVLAVGLEEPDWNSIECEEDSLPKKFLDKNKESRIIGGKIATQGQFPYQAGLYMSKTTYGIWCGGILISESYVLTSAYCGINALYIDVYLGAQNIRNLTENGRLNVRVPAENVVVHDAYNPGAIANNIAILLLPEPVNITETIKPINLPSYNDAARDFAGTTLVISGWGKNANNGETSNDELQFASVHLRVFLQDRKDIKHLYRDNLWSTCMQR